MSDAMSVVLNGDSQQRWLAFSAFDNNFLWMRLSERSLACFAAETREFLGRCQVVWGGSDKEPVGWAGYEELGEKKRVRLFWLVPGEPWEGRADVGHRRGRAYRLVEDYGAYEDWVSLYRVVFDEVEEHHSSDFGLKLLREVSAAQARAGGVASGAQERQLRDEFGFSVGDQRQLSVGEAEGLLKFCEGAFMVYEHMTQPGVVYNLPLFDNPVQSGEVVIDGPEVGIANERRAVVNLKAQNKRRGMDELPPEYSLMDLLINQCLEDRSETVRAWGVYRLVGDSASWKTGIPVRVEYSAVAEAKAKVGGQAGWSALEYVFKNVNEEVLDRLLGELSAWGFIVGVAPRVYRLPDFDELCERLAKYAHDNYRFPSVFGIVEMLREGVTRTRRLKRGAAIAKAKLIKLQELLPRPAVYYPAEWQNGADHWAGSPFPDFGDDPVGEVGLWLTGRKTVFPSLDAARFGLFLLYGGVRFKLKVLENGWCAFETPLYGTLAVAPRGAVVADESVGEGVTVFQPLHSFSNSAAITGVRNESGKAVEVIFGECRKCGGLGILRLGGEGKRKKDKVCVGNDHHGQGKRVLGGLEAAFYAALLATAGVDQQDKGLIAVNVVGFGRMTGEDRSWDVMGAGGGVRSEG